MKPMKIFAYCCLVISSLLVLAWPLIFFGSIFLFDAPTRDALYEFEKEWAPSFSQLLIRGHLSWHSSASGLKTKDQEWWTKKLTIFFLLWPIAQLGLAFLVTN